MGHFTQLDGIVLVGYFILTLAVGVFFWSRSRSTESFTAAGRSLPGWLVGLSIFATYVSSISYLALPGKAFATNWNAFVSSLTIPLTTWIAVVWFLPYYRKTNDISAYASLERRFGPWARLYASFCYLLLQLARIGVVTYLLALPMSVIFGWNIATIIIVTGVVVTAYTFVGGILAVVWTDAIQTIVLLVGVVITLIILFVQLGGNCPEAFAYAWNEGKFSWGTPGVSCNRLGNVSFDFGHATILVILMFGLCENLKNFGIDQNYIQRYMLAKNESEAKKSLWLGAMIYLPVCALFFLIGTMLFMLYQTGPDRETDLREVKQAVAHQKLMQEGTAPEYTFDSKSGRQVFTEQYRQKIEAVSATLQDKDIGDQVFPHFIGKYMPPGLTGLMIAAIFSAGMSTISTSLNSSATLLLRDYYLRFFRPNASEKESMRVLYAGTITWGVLGTGVALLLIRLTDSALDIFWTLSGIFAGGMLGLFLIGLLIKRSRNGSALAAACIGTVMIGWLSVPEILHWLERHGAVVAAEQLRTLVEHCGGVNPFHPFLTPMLGTVTMLVFAFLISRLWSPDVRGGP